MKKIASIDKIIRMNKLLNKAKIKINILVVVNNFDKELFDY